MSLTAFVILGLAGGQPSLWKDVKVQFEHVPEQICSVSLTFGTKSATFRCISAKPFEKKIAAMDKDTRLILISLDTEQFPWSAVFLAKRNRSITCPTGWVMSYPQPAVGLKRGVFVQESKARWAQASGGFDPDDIIRRVWTYDRRSHSLKASKYRLVQHAR